MATSGNFSTSNQYIKYRIVVTENSTSIENNTSTVNVKVQAWRTNQGYTTYGSGTCYATIDGVNYSQSISSSQKLTYNSYTTLLDKTVTINHNSDGSKTIYVSAYINHARFSSNSQGFNITLTTIPRQATLLSAQDFNDNANPTITYSNPAGNSITSLQACISVGGSVVVAYRDISKTASSYTFTLTQAERNALLSLTPTSDRLALSFIVKSVIGGVTYYSSINKTMFVINASPTITGAGYKDTKATTVAITNNDQYIIQKHSILAFTFTNLQALKYSTLAYMQITVNGEVKTFTLSGTSAANQTFTFGVLDINENITASVSLFDSRGFATALNINILVYSWAAPWANISGKRVSNYYAETDIYNGTGYASLGGNNTISSTWYYKETGASSWSTGGAIAQYETVRFTLDNEKSYDLKIVSSDRLATSEATAIVPVGVPLLFFDNKNKGVGIQTTKTDGTLGLGKGWALISSLGNTIARLVKNSGGTGQVGQGTNLIFFEDSSNSRPYLYLSASNTDSSLQLYNWASSGNPLKIQAHSTDGSITCVSLTQTSSRKVKKNIKPLGKEEAYKILKLEAVKFDFIDRRQGENKAGFIAEDVAEILPSLVKPETDKANASLDYIGIIPFLQATIKEQDKRISELERKLEELISKLDK